MCTEQKFGLVPQRGFELKAKKNIWPYYIDYDHFKIEHFFVQLHRHISSFESYAVWLLFLSKKVPIWNIVMACAKNVCMGKKSFLGGLKAHTRQLHKVGIKTHFISQ